MGGVIWVMTGSEGSGKSCWMTLLALWHGARTAEFYGYPNIETYCKNPKFSKPIRTFPGYDVHGQRDTVNEKLELSKQINLGKWMRNFGDDEHRNMVVCIDEMQNTFDSMLSNVVATRVFSHAMAQRRRSAVSVLATIQNWDYAPNRIRFTTHLVSVCTDLYWSKWGKEEGLKRGELFKIITWDAKGMYTGEPWHLYSNILFRGKNIWPYYDSFVPSDFMEQESTRYMINKTDKYINEDDDEEDIDYDSMDNFSYDPESKMFIPSSDAEKRARFNYGENYHNPSDEMIENDVNAIRDIKSREDILDDENITPQTRGKMLRLMRKIENEKKS